MLAALLLTLREGLEAALLIGITIGVLRRLGKQELRSFVWIGVGAAVVVSLVAAVGLQAFGARLEGASEASFEAATMLLAAGVLTWMILWMQRQGRQVRTALEAEVETAVQRNQRLGILLIAFTAVLREGVETGLFLTAAAMTAEATEILTGALLGLTAAVGVGGALYAATVRLNLRRFFQITGILLMFFAAGLVAHAVHELNEIGLIPSMIAPLWDLNHVVDEASALGEASKALFGYNADPSLTEALAYLTYFALLGAVLLRARRPPPVRAGT